MSKKKKIVLISIVVVIVLAVGIFALVRHLNRKPTEGTCGYGVIWSYDGEGTLTISGNGYMTGTGEWYYYAQEITRIEIEEGVLSVCDYAFSGINSGNYRKVERIELPDTLIEIGRYAFAGQISVKQLEIPGSVQRIGAGAFEECSGIKKIDIPDGVISIEQRTFNDCTGLASVNLPNKLAHIGGSAFANTALEELVIPKSVNTIEEFAFSGCNKLTSITFLGDNPFELEVDDEGKYKFLWAFSYVTTTAYWPGDNDTWIGFPTAYLGGDIEWIPY